VVLIDVINATNVRVCLDKSSST